MESRPLKFRYKSVITAMVHPLVSFCTCRKVFRIGNSTHYRISVVVDGNSPAGIIPRAGFSSTILSLPLCHKTCLFPLFEILVADQFDPLALNGCFHHGAGKHAGHAIPVQGHILISLVPDGLHFRVFEAGMIDK